ncbi:MAG TPA: branched-chain amino acid ABC transporter permease [Streptosporangiaceae bacterium]
MIFLAQNLVDGITVGAVYVLIALSITMVFGLTGIVNFAVGDLLMVAAFVVYTLVQHGVSYYLASAIAVVAMALLGLILERVAFRWTLSKPENGFVVSLGLILILEAGAVLIWGTTSRAVSTPLSGAIHAGQIVIGTSNLVVLGTVVVVTTIFLIWLSRARDGRALRAASENREAAQLMGIPTVRLTMIVFVIATALVGLAGALVTTFSTVQPFMGADFLLIAFVIAILGGMGSVLGTLLSGLAVAVIQSLAQGYLPLNWSDGFVFAAVVLMLLWRPEGLLGLRHG